MPIRRQALIVACPESADSIQWPPLPELMGTAERLRQDYKSPYIGACDKVKLLDRNASNEDIITSANEFLARPNTLTIVHVIGHGDDHFADFRLVTKSTSRFNDGLAIVSRIVDEMGRLPSAAEPDPRAGVILLLDACKAGGASQDAYAVGLRSGVHRRLALVTSTFTEYTLGPNFSEALCECMESPPANALGPFLSVNDLHEAVSARRNNLVKDRSAVPTIAPTGEAYTMDIGSSTLWLCRNRRHPRVRFEESTQQLGKSLLRPSFVPTSTTFSLRRAVDENTVTILEGEAGSGKSAAMGWSFADLWAGLDVGTLLVNDEQQNSGLPVPANQSAHENNTAFAHVMPRWRLDHLADHLASQLLKSSCQFDSATKRYARQVSQHRFLPRIERDILGPLSTLKATHQRTYLFIDSLQILPDYQLAEFFRILRRTVDRAPLDWPVHIAISLGMHGSADAWPHAHRSALVSDFLAHTKHCLIPVCSPTAAEIMDYSTAVTLLRPKGPPKPEFADPGRTWLQVVALDTASRWATESRLNPCAGEGDARLDPYYDLVLESLLKTCEGAATTLCIATCHHGRFLPVSTILEAGNALLKAGICADIHATPSHVDKSGTSPTVQPLHTQHPAERHKPELRLNEQLVRDLAHASGGIIVWVDEEVGMIHSAVHEYLNRIPARSEIPTSDEAADKPHTNPAQLKNWWEAVKTAHVEVEKALGTKITKLEKEIGESTHGKAKDALVRSLGHLQAIRAEYQWSEPDKEKQVGRRRAAVAWLEEVADSLTHRWHVGQPTQELEWAADILQRWVPRIVADGRSTFADHPSSRCGMHTEEWHAICRIALTHAKHIAGSGHLNDACELLIKLTDGQPHLSGGGWLKAISHVDDEDISVGEAWSRNPLDPLIEVRLELARWTGKAGKAGVARDLLKKVDLHQPPSGYDLTPELRLLDVRAEYQHARWVGYLGDHPSARERMLKLVHSEPTTHQKDIKQQRAADRLRWYRWSAEVALCHWDGESGRIAKALTGLERIVGEQRRAAGLQRPDGPPSILPRMLDLYRTRSEIARWKGELHCHQAAADDLETILRDQSEVYGWMHPNTMNTRRSLARWRARAGDVQVAIRELEELLEDMSVVLGDWHPDLTISRLVLADIIGEHVDPSQALEVLRAGQGHREQESTARVQGTVTNSGRVPEPTAGRNPSGATGELLPDTSASEQECSSLGAYTQLSYRSKLAFWRYQAGEIQTMREVRRAFDPLVMGQEPYSELEPQSLCRLAVRRHYADVLGDLRAPQRALEQLSSALHTFLVGHARSGFSLLERLTRVRRPSTGIDYNLNPNLTHLLAQMIVALSSSSPERATPTGHAHRDGHDTRGQDGVWVMTPSGHVLCTHSIGKRVSLKAVIALLESVPKSQRKTIPNDLFTPGELITCLNPQLFGILRDFAYRLLHAALPRPAETLSWFLERLTLGYYGKHSRQHLAAIRFRSDCLCDLGTPETAEEELRRSLGDLPASVDVTERLKLRVAWAKARLDLFDPNESERPDPSVMLDDVLKTLRNMHENPEEWVAVEELLARANGERGECEEAAQQVQSLLDMGAQAPTSLGGRRRDENTRNRQLALYNWRGEQDREWFKSSADEIRRLRITLENAQQETSSVIPHQRARRAKDHEGELQRIRSGLPLATLCEYAEELRWTLLHQVALLRSDTPPLTRSDHSDVDMAGEIKWSLGLLDAVHERATKFQHVSALRIALLRLQAHIECELLQVDSDPHIAMSDWADLMETASMTFQPKTVSDGRKNETDSEIRVNLCLSELCTMGHIQVHHILLGFRWWLANQDARLVTASHRRVWTKRLANAHYVIRHENRRNVVASALERAKRTPTKPGSLWAAMYHLGPTPPDGRTKKR